MKIFAYSMSLLTILTSLALSARPNSAALIQETAKSLTTVALKCPERMWPGIDWSRHAVLFVADGNSPMIWRGSTGNLEAFPANEVPDEVRERLYSFVDVRGIQTLAIHLSPEDLSDPTMSLSEPQKLFGLIIHEGFHAFNQQGWAPDKANPMSHYPLDSRPRMARRMSYERLKESFRGNQDAFPKAAFWFRFWKQTFQQESASNTDRTEGSARYVDFVASILAESGCELGEEDLKAKIITKLNFELDRYFIRDDSSLPSEAYGLGALQLLKLRFDQPDLKWTELIEAGSSPGDVLFSQVGSQEDSADSRLVRETEKRYREKNSLVGRILGDLPTQLENPSFVRISIGGNRFPEDLWNTFSLDAEEKKVFTVLNDDFKLPSKSVALNFESFGGYFTLAENPCQGGGMVVLAPLQNFNSVKERVSYKGVRYAIQAGGKMVKTKDGNIWLCVSP